MSRVYIAAPLKAVGLAYGLARTLEKDCHQIVSSWHDLVGPEAEDPISDDEREDVWYDNMRDLSKADVVVFLWPEDFQPRSALVEVGIALERGLNVVWWGKRCLADACTSVRRVDDYNKIKDAL